MGPISVKCCVAGQFGAHVDFNDINRLDFINAIVVFAQHIVARTLARIIEQKIMHFNFLLNYLHNTHLSITVYAVRGPAARLHLIGVQAPEFELLLEQRSAHIGRIVQLSGSVGKNKVEKERSETVVCCQLMR